MPVMDDIESPRGGFARRQDHELPILATTANAMAGDRERSLAAGMNDHVTKPIDPEELFDVLDRWLPERGLTTPAVDALPTAGAVAPGAGARERRRLAARDSGSGCGRRLAAGPGQSNRVRRAAPPLRIEPGHAWRPIFARRCQKAAQLTPSEAPTRSRAWREALEPGSCNAKRARWRRRCGVAIDGALVAPVLGRTADILQRLLAAIAASLPPETAVARPPATVDRQALEDAVQRLDRLLSQDAVEAIDLFVASQPLLAAAYGERTGEIGRLLTGYRFEDALAALRAAREET